MRVHATGATCRSPPVGSRWSATPSSRSTGSAGLTSASTTTSAARSTSTTRCSSRTSGRSPTSSRRSTRCSPRCSPTRSPACKPPTWSCTPTGMRSPTGPRRYRCSATRSTTASRSIRDHEARDVASILQAIKRDEWPVVEAGGTTRPASYADVAILIPSRTVLPDDRGCARACGHPGAGREPIARVRHRGDPRSGLDPLCHRRPDGRDLGRRRAPLPRVRLHRRRARSVRALRRALGLPRRSEHHTGRDLRDAPGGRGPPRTARVLGPAVVAEREPDRGGRRSRAVAAGARGGSPAPA